MTPEEILNIFIEEHRLCSPLDPEADMWVKLSMTSTINDWRNARDLISWKPLSQFLNSEFYILATEEEWKSVLTPPSKRTVKDVCELISRHFITEEIKPINLFGQECISAAVFRTLKKYLQRRQVDVSNLKPSSLVLPYLQNYFSPLIEQTTILSKGGKVFEKLEYNKPKRSFLSRLIVFENFSLAETEIKTFRDLTLKIIEANQQTA